MIAVSAIIIHHYYYQLTAAAGDPAKIKSVVINPDPPKKGQPVTVNATITLSKNTALVNRIVLYVM